MANTGQYDSQTNIETEDYEREIFVRPEAAVIYGGGGVNSVNGYTGDVVLTTSDLENTSDYQTGTEVESAISTAIEGKQDTLTAGNNITISNNTISATDTTYTAGTGLALNGTQFSVDTTAIATQSDLTAGLATKQDTLTAGTNIQINNNTISATDTTYSAFTGTDGQTAGTAGLVPAPATTDAGKFLGASGLWETVQAGGVTELTSADYNYPTNNPDGVAMWKLDTGIYSVATGTKVYVTTSSSSTATYRGIFLLHNNGYQSSYLMVKGADASMQYWDVTISTGIAREQFYISQPVDKLTSSSEYAPLSANQGKVLKDLIDSLAFKNAGAPTTSTVGTVGQLLEDTTNGKLYICTAVTPGTDPDPDTYTWSEVGAGGSTITVLTSSDYNYPSDNPTKIAAWTLDDGIYEFESTTVAGNVYYENGNSDPVNTSSVIMFEVSSNVTNGRKTVVGYYENNGIMLYPSFSMTVNASTGVRITNGFYYNLSTHSVEQSTGTNTSRPMSQNAVTSMVFQDPNLRKRPQIGDSASATGNAAIAIGTASTATKEVAIGIGYGSSATAKGAVAIGAASSATSVGEMNIGSSNTTYGYSSSNYRLLTGLYDPQSAHDAATKGYVDNSLLGKANKISVVQTSASTIEINPNTFYKFGEVASLNITLASITDNTIYNEYMFEFVSGSTATTLTLPSSIKWLETPTIDANKIYQCSIVDNVGLLVGVANV